MESLSMEATGQVFKMKSLLENPVRYILPIGNDLVEMNSLIGKKLQFQFDGTILCIRCGRKTKKSFAHHF